jgi:hypothetical protein
MNAYQVFNFFIADQNMNLLTALKQTYLALKLYDEEIQIDLDTFKDMLLYGVDPANKEHLEFSKDELVYLDKIAKFYYFENGNIDQNLPDLLQKFKQFSPGLTFLEDKALERQRRKDRAKRSSELLGDAYEVTLHPSVKN